MSLFKSYWSVQGISLNARNAAIRAAEAEGEELGDWLSRLINKVSTEELAAVTVAKDRVEDTNDTLDATNDHVDATNNNEDATNEQVDATNDNVETAEENLEDPDDKLSSIERAMKQARASGEMGPA